MWQTLSDDLDRADLFVEASVRRVERAVFESTQALRTLGGSGGDGDGGAAGAASGGGARRGGAAVDFELKVDGSTWNRAQGGQRRGGGRRGLRSRNRRRWAARGSRV